MRPTRLYVKEHTVTGLRYFGKTIREDIEKYKGSGQYWKAHMRMHGFDVKTLWVSEWFIDAESIAEFAELFSELFDVVNDSKWANLKPENGLDAGPHSEQTKAKISKANRGRKLSDRHREILREVNRGTRNRVGKKQSPETRKKMSISQQARRNTILYTV